MHDGLETHGIDKTTERRAENRKTVDMVRDRSGSQQTRRRRCSNPEENAHAHNGNGNVQCWYDNVM